MSGGAAAGAQAASHLTLEVKVVVVGDAGTGKTSIIAAFTRGELNAATRPSIGVAYSKRTISEPGVTVNFAIWDTAGQERFRSVNTLYYRGAGAALLVYDVTCAQSFESLEYWLKEVRENGGRDMIVVVCGNKCDAGKAARQVPAETARAFAERHGTLLVETSARTGTNIEEMFRMVVREAPRHVDSGAEGGFRVISNERASVDLDTDSGLSGSRTGTGCCGTA